MQAFVPGADGHGNCSSLAVLTISRFFPLSLSFQTFGYELYMYKLTLQFVRALLVNPESTASSDKFQFGRSSV